MFGVVPRQVWEKRYPSQEDKCPMGMNIILLERGDRKIIIDTGVGSKNRLKLDGYGFHSLVDLREVIVSKGISPEEITDVVLTHLHFDHCGGCTFVDEQNQLSVSFPNATHWISRKQWEQLQSPTLLDEDAYSLDNIAPLFENNLVKLIDTDTTIFEGFRLELYDGHTPGQIVAVFDADDSTYCYTGDVLPTAAHLSPLWISAYDLYPVDSVNEKIRLLEKAVARNWALITYHDVYQPIIRAKKAGKIYRIAEKVTFQKRD